MGDPRRGGPGGPAVGDRTDVSARRELHEDEPGARELRLSLVPHPECAREARLALRRAGLDEDVRHTVELLVTEVFATAMRTAAGGDGARIVLRAHLAEDFARLEIVGPGPGFRRASLDGELCLKLLDTLTTGWGAAESARGCSVWFEVDRRSGTRPAPDAP